MLLLFIVDNCRRREQMADDAVSTLSDSLTSFTNKLGLQSVHIATLQVNKAQLQDIVLAKDKKLAALTKEYSRVNAIVQYNQLVKYDTINVSYKDTVPCIFNRAGNVSTKWYSFNYNASQGGFTIDSLSINNQATSITGFKRSWFLGKETIVTEVTNTNPHVTVGTLKSIAIVVPVPWYKKWYVWLGAGIVGGLLAR